MQSYCKEKKVILSFRRRLLFDLRVLCSLLQLTLGLFFLRKGYCEISQNEAEFMRDGGKVQKAFLAAQNSKLAQQLTNVQKHVATIHRPLPEYRLKLFSDVESGFQEF